MNLQTPQYTHAEARSRETFLALLQATSRPGTSHALPAVGPADSFVSIATALLDLETTFICPDADLLPQLRPCGAREVAASEADYWFVPRLTAEDLDALAQAKAGTMVYPDRSATLVIGARLGGGRSLTLSGPGLPQPLTIQVADLPEEFWPLRQAHNHYPLGWDIFLVDGTTVVGIPRSTAIELD